MTKQCPLTPEYTYYTNHITLSIPYFPIGSISNPALTQHDELLTRGGGTQGHESNLSASRPAAHATHLL